MVLVVLFMFAFQNAYGYVYQMIGAIFASFMLGLILGTVAAGRLSKKIHAYYVLAGAQVLAIIFLALVPALLPAVDGLAGSGIICFAYILLTAATGLLVGLIVPLGNTAFFEYVPRTGVTAGLIYAVDIFGGCIGAMVAGAFIIPIFGLFATTYFLLILNTIALGGLLICVRK